MQAANKKLAQKNASVGKKAPAEADLPMIVSLFSGAGGLDLGFAQAGFSIAIAIDSESAAISSHSANFPSTKGVAADLVELGPTGVSKLVQQVIPTGAKIGVIGGPPCQGFSRANTASQHADPRNELPSLYIKIIRKLQKLYSVEFVVFENVLGIRDSRHAVKYAELLADLKRSKFVVTEKELCAVDFGVPQTRRRIVLSGVRKDGNYGAIKPKTESGKISVRDAIGHIKAEPTFFRHGLAESDIALHPNHWTMAPKSKRFSEPQSMSADGRSFKKLNWDLPSPTVAYGNREIHVHPSGTRRLSVYEAMLLQGFPESFQIKGNLSEQVQQVSNAVPPPLAKAVADAVRAALTQGLTLPSTPSGR